MPATDQLARIRLIDIPAADLARWQEVGRRLETVTYAVLCELAGVKDAAPGSVEIPKALAIAADAIDLSNEGLAPSFDDLDIPLRCD